ncbi:MAG: hypothetical protein JSU66_12345 [Deltaproteobacteria bacterium]|nr:MAG: hypothetical protein JSU66_12345 [Deltaproteobacteria bacterium]
MLHHFIPDAEPPPRSRGGEPSIVVVPIGARDVLRAAFVWNLAFEIAREGASADIVGPDDGDPTALWPYVGAGPLGTGVTIAAAHGPADLLRAARDLADARTAESTHGIVLARVPPGWLGTAADAGTLLRWSLLFSAADRRDLLETYALAKRLLCAAPSMRIGVVIHGVRRVAEAERAFSRLAQAARRHLGARIASYGLLVDDLHLVRSIASRRPVGLVHPQSPAARALRDVARLILADACGDGDA